MKYNIHSKKAKVEKWEEKSCMQMLSAAGWMFFVPDCLEEVVSRWTFDSIFLFDFWCVEASFSFAVTSLVSERWRSSSQEELGEHSHLRTNSSETSSISLKPPSAPPLPSNLYSLLRILHMLSWFCCSPCSVSFLSLWWNISPSLSLCLSFTVWFRKYKNSLVLDAKQGKKQTFQCGGIGANLVQSFQLFFLSDLPVICLLSPTAHDLPHVRISDLSSQPD